MLAPYLPPRAVSFSHGTHAAVVEVDPGTCPVRVLTYAVVNDCGRLINPAMVGGPIHGGVAQEVGAVFLESLRYDSQGQLVTTPSSTNRCR